MSTKATEQQLAQGVLLHGIGILDNCLADSSTIDRYLKRLSDEYLNYPSPKENIDINEWMIPEEYRIMNIEEYLVNICPEENYDRLIMELELYRKHNMIPVLKAIKYLVDTLRKNSVVWGVGRGSSVSSYVLFLLGIHKIDSVKYNLPIEEFFKGGENG
jgi:DNA polymerase III alpha subunit